MQWRARPRRTSARPWSRCPAERTSQRRLCLSSALTASAQVIFVPAASVSMKFDGTRSTYAWSSASKCSRSSRAVAVHLVPAVEVRPDPVGGGVLADVDGQLPLGAEPQVQRQPHDQGLHRVLEVLAGDPLAGADQRVPGLFPHVGQVHGVDPVGHLPRAPQVLPLDPAVASPAFSCPVSSIAPITRPRRRFPRRAASSSPATANRRTTPIAAKVSQLA